MTDDFFGSHIRKTLERILDKAEEFKEEGDARDAETQPVDIREQLAERKFNSAPQDTYAQLVLLGNNAMSAYDSKDFETSAELFEQYINSEFVMPLDEEYFVLSHSYFEIQNYERAIEVCTEALDTVSDKSTFYLMLANCFSKASTSEGFDNEQYCHTKAMEYLSHTNDMPNMLKLILDRVDFEKRKEVVDSFADSYEDKKGFYSCRYTTKQGAVGFIVFPTITIEDEKCNPMELQRDTLMPEVFKQIRQTTTRRTLNPAYIHTDILADYGVSPEAISFRTYEL